MQQNLTINFEESLNNFLSHYQKYGFKNESEMIKVALQKLQSELEKKDLEESAILYAEIYQEDAELRELTQIACADFREI